MPILIDPLAGPQDILEHSEALKVVRTNFVNLSDNQQKVVKLLFGMEGKSPQSISKVCQQMSISRPACVKILDQVLNILRRNIQL